MHAATLHAALALLLYFPGQEVNSSASLNSHHTPTRPQHGVRSAAQRSASIESELGGLPGRIPRRFEALAVCGVGGGVGAHLTLVWNTRQPM